MFLLLQVAVVVHQIMEMVVQEEVLRVSQEVVQEGVHLVHNRQVVHGDTPLIAHILEVNAVVAVVAIMEDIVPLLKIMQVVVGLAI